MVVPVSEGQSLPGPPLSYSPDLERLEIELLLEGAYRHYGFDFRAYAYASIRRRLWKRVEGEGLPLAHRYNHTRIRLSNCSVSTGLVM